MFPPSSTTSAAKSFLWTFPECPVRIHINLQFIERLSKQILGPAPAEREVGGLLIGQELSHSGDIEVSDHFQLPPASESTRNFAVCSESLDQSIKTASTTQGRVIGFYRTHLDQRMQLRPEDLECARSKFKEPMNVFLLIRPHDGRASGAFFFWQDGAVNGGLTFPFSSTELKSSSWSTLVGGSPRPSAVQGLVARAKERTLEASSGVRIGVVVLIAILLAAAGALRFYRPLPPPRPKFLKRSDCGWKEPFGRYSGMESSGSGNRDRQGRRSADLGRLQPACICATDDRPVTRWKNILYIL